VLICALKGDFFVVVGFFWGVEGVDSVAFFVICVVLWFCCCCFFSFGLPKAAEEKSWE